MIVTLQCIKLYPKKGKKMSSIETMSVRPLAQSRSGGSFFRSVRDHIALWRQVHRTRVHLLALSETELVDLGLTRAAAREEAMRPFWDTGKRREGRS